MKSFIEKVLAGKATAESIDNFIDQWHEGNGSETLPDYLGMTEDEYALWVETPEALDLIIQARTAGMRLQKASAD